LDDFKKSRDDDGNDHLMIIESLSTVENIRIKNLQVEERSFNNNFIQYLQTPVFNDLVNLRLEDITLADADVLDLLGSLQLLESFYIKTK
jgi:hypothetical protein